MKRTHIMVLVLVGVIAATMVMAQTPPTPPTPHQRAQHRVQFLTTLLSLNTSQQQQATTIFTNAATTETSLHDNMKSARQALTTAVKNNDSNGIDQAAGTIGNLTAQQLSNEAKANAAFYQILTADQRTKLDQLEAERHGPGMMGPGMGRGPRP